MNATTSIVPPSRWQRLLTSDLLYSFRRSPVAMLAAFIALSCIVCAVFAKQLAPHKKQADKLEQELAAVQDKLATLEGRLGDNSLYEAARKDELRELLAEQSRLKTRESELEEAWLEALETLEALQQQLAAAE